MNFIFISPHFPKTYWNFCDRLKRNGVNVPGIGDAAYDSLDENLKFVLTEYYYLPSLENYDAVYRAVAFFASKYCRILGLLWILSALFRNKAPGESSVMPLEKIVTVHMACEQ